jgi:hypothetical protein
MSLPSPTAIWTESPTSLAARRIPILLPYRTLEGYWIFVEARDAPAGATRGAIVRGPDGEANVLTTSTTVGRRLARMPSGPLLIS